MLTRHPSLRITAENIISHPFVSQYTAYAPPCLPSFSFNFNSTRLSKGAIPLVFDPRKNVRMVVQPLGVLSDQHSHDRFIYGVRNLRPLQSGRWSGTPLLHTRRSGVLRWLSQTLSTTPGRFLTKTMSLPPEISLRSPTSNRRSTPSPRPWNGTFIPREYIRNGNPGSETSDNIQSVVALAAAIADRKKYQWSSLKIVGAALQTPPYPETLHLVPPTSGGGTKNRPSPL